MNAFGPPESPAAKDVERLLLAMDAADTAFMLFDPEDRLLFASRRLQQLYGDPLSPAQRGRSFESITRELVAQGLVPVPAAEREAWLAERLRLHREGGSVVRRMPDGSWRRIVEQRLPDGSRLSYSSDVSDLVAKEAELTRARDEAQAAHQRLRNVIDALPVGLSLFDEDDRLVMSNRALLAIHPLIADLLDQPGADFETLVRANFERGGLPGLDGEQFEAHLANRIQGRARTESRGRFFTGERWIEPIERRTPEGWIVGVQVDVTELVEQRQTAEKAEAWLQHAMGLLPSGFALFDAEDRLLLCNQRFVELHGLQPDEAQPGRRFAELLTLGVRRGHFKAAAPDQDDWVAAVMAQRQGHGELAHIVALSDERWIRVLQRRTRDGALAMAVTEVTDLVRRERELLRLNRELESARQELQRQSLTDPLTSLANRRLLDRRLPLDWARCARMRQPMAMLLIDVDHFKRYNDHHGHPAGDACLRQVAQALAAVVNREIDLVARYGGEEFAVLLPHTDLDGARQIALACLEAVDGAAIAHGDSPVGPWVSISVGVAAVADAHDAAGGAQALLQAADDALRQAKAGGRHRVEAVAAA